MCLQCRDTRGHKSFKHLAARNTSQQHISSSELENFREDFATVTEFYRRNISLKFRLL